MTKNHIEFLPHTIKPIIKEIGRQAHAMKLEVYLVGGLVRDLCLASKQAAVDGRDIDVIVPKSAEALAKRLTKTFKAKMIYYPVFQTATLTLSSGVSIDIITSRREDYPYPGALPVIEPSDLGDDLFRRDFTINAMAMDLRLGHWGKLVDPLGGLMDLKKRQLRVMHERSFRDDPTRLWRMARYAARFSLAIETHTWVIAKEAIRDQVWLTVKPQRWWIEMKRLLKEKNPIPVFSLLHDWKALAMPIMPLVFDPRRLGLAAKANKDLAKDHQEGCEVLWLSALHDLSRREDIPFIGQHLGLSQKEMVILDDVMRSSYILGALSVKHMSRYQVYRLLSPISIVALRLIFAEAKGVAKRRIDEFLKGVKSFVLHVDGHDLNDWGVKPGTAMKAYLTALTQQCINDKVYTPAAQKRLAKIMIKRFLC